MNILFVVINSFLLGGIIWLAWKRDQSSIKKFYWPAVTLKLSAGILLGIIYSKFYSSGDTFSFFSAAVEVSARARTDLFWYADYLLTQSDGYFLGEARTLFFVKVTSVIALLTHDHYWISSLYFSLISFFAAWWLTKTISNYFPQCSTAAAFAFLFFPSCVFWSAGLMKESLAMAGLFCIAAVFLRVWIENKISFKGVLIVVFSAWVVWNLKYYYIALFIPVLFSSLVVKGIVDFWKMKHIGFEVLLWFGLLLFVLFGATFIHPNFSLNRVLDVIVTNNVTVVKASSPASVIRYGNLEANWLSMMVNSPWALFSGLFRPFAWEVDSVLKIIASIENLVLLVLAFLAIPSVSAIKTSPHRLLILSILTYSILLCIFLALSTPNMGTLVRYRVGFLPFFVLLILNHPIINKALSKVL